MSQKICVVCRMRETTYLKNKKKCIVDSRIYGEHRFMTRTEIQKEQEVSARAFTMYFDLQ